MPLPPTTDRTGRNHNARVGALIGVFFIRQINGKIFCGGVRLSTLSIAVYFVTDVLLEDFRNLTSKSYRAYHAILSPLTRIIGAICKSRLLSSLRLSYAVLSMNYTSSLTNRSVTGESGRSSIVMLANYLTERAYRYITTLLRNCIILDGDLRKLSHNSFVSPVSPYLRR